MNIRFLTSFFLCALSTVFAATWSETNTGRPSAVAGVAALTIYALSNNGGVVKSTDGGASWNPISDGLTSLIDTRSRLTALVIDPSDSNLLCVGASDSGVSRSTVGGGHWSSFNGGLSNLDVRALALAPSAGHTLYAATGGGVFAIAVDRKPVQSVAIREILGAET
jgi:photosystem II stability/assembly factor-like uncharacterized protein